VSARTPSSTLEGESLVAELHVELVAVERPIWSGEATMVVARTTEGELGILPGEAPLLGQLVEDGVVRIKRTGEDELVVAVRGGFLSITRDGVSVLAEEALLATEIDTEAARADLAENDGSDDEEAKSAAAWARGRLRAVGENV
jgi:F-type H+-transporting ATPase subunit epsilon